MLPTAVKTRKAPITEFNEEGSTLDQASRTYDAERVGINAPRKTKLKALILGLVVGCITCLLGIISVVTGWQTLQAAVSEIIMMGAAVAALRKGHEVF